MYTESLGQQGEATENRVVIGAVRDSGLSLLLSEVEDSKESVTKAISSSWSLGKILRDQLNLTGTKISCGIGDCSACTILLDSRAVKSCIYPALQAWGKKIVTIEGLRGKDGGLHPLQAAFMEHFAIQCGYCTPGMILTGGR